MSAIVQRLGPKQMGRVGALCPNSDLNLLGNGQSVIDLDLKVSDGTLDPDDLTKAEQREDSRCAYRSG
jgi:hypothetical protein